LVLHKKRTRGDTYFGYWLRKREYSTKFRVFSEGKIDSYVGVDIQPRKEWQCSQKEDVKFFRYFDFFIDNRNLPVSQSALEHIEDDIVLY
jgi:hypothetical protein